MKDILILTIFYGDRWGDSTNTRTLYFSNRKALDEAWERDKQSVIDSIDEWQDILIVSFQHIELDTQKVINNVRLYEAYSNDYIEDQIALHTRYKDGNWEETIAELKNAKRLSA